MPKNPSTKNANWLTPEKWLPWYDEALRLTAEGRSTTEISEIVGKSIPVITRVRRATYFQDKLAQVQKVVVRTITSRQISELNTDEVKEARRVINKNAAMAAIMVVQISQNGTYQDTCRLKACQDILDRAGLKAPVVTEQNVHERTYSPEEVSHAKQILVETQAIIERLATQPNSFVLRDRRAIEVESSETEKAHDVQQEATSGTT